MAVTIDLLRRLSEQQVEFVLIGGLAAEAIRQLEALRRELDEQQ